MTFIDAANKISLEVSYICLLLSTSPLTYNQSNLYFVKLVQFIIPALIIEYLKAKI